MTVEEYREAISIVGSASSGRILNAIDIDEGMAESALGKGMSPEQAWSYISASTSRERAKDTAWLLFKIFIVGLFLLIVISPWLLTVLSPNK